MRIIVQAFLVVGLVLTEGSFCARAQTDQPPPAAALQGNDELLALIETASKAPTKKDEFETTEQFERRRSAGVGRNFLVTLSAVTDSFILGPKPLAYNADTQTLIVTLRGDSSIDLMKVFDSLSPEGRKISPTAMLTGSYSKFTLVKRGPTLEKEYPAQNSFGAATKVSVFRSTFSSVALLNLPEAPSGTGMATMTVSMAPDAAREFFKRAQWKLLVQIAMAPGQQALVLEDGSYHAPTITEPNESYTVGKTITATLLRAELVDPQTGGVVASFGPQNAKTGVAKAKVMLGVQLEPVSLVLATKLGLSDASGGLVHSVAPGSAAELAGIKAGDILLRVGDKAITSPVDVQAAMAGVSPGATIQIEILREQTHSTLKVHF
jgi:hypothetical protein